MESLHIVKPVMENGRFLLPKKGRELLQVECNDTVECSAGPDGIYIRKHMEHCLFCGGTENVIAFKDKKICCHCLQALRSLDI